MWNAYYEKTNIFRFIWEPKVLRNLLCKWKSNSRNKNN